MGPSYFKKIKNVVRIFDPCYKFEHPIFKSLLYLRKFLKNQSEGTVKVFKRWGYYESLTQGKGYQIKKLYLLPYSQISLQSHQHRAEFWIVVQGTAKFHKGELQGTLNTQETLYIEKNEKHQVINPNSDILEIVEIQFGDYLEEDDIIHYKS